MGSATQRLRSKARGTRSATESKREGERKIHLHLLQSPPPPRPIHSTITHREAPLRHSLPNQHHPNQPPPTLLPPFPPPSPPFSISQPSRLTNRVNSVQHPSSSSSFQTTKQPPFSSTLHLHHKSNLPPPIQLSTIFIFFNPPSTSHLHPPTPPNPSFHNHPPSPNPSTDQPLLTIVDPTRTVMPASHRTEPTSVKLSNLRPTCEPSPPYWRHPSRSPRAQPPSTVPCTSVWPALQIRHLPSTASRPTRPRPAGHEAPLRSSPTVERRPPCLSPQAHTRSTHTPDPTHAPTPRSGPTVSSLTEPLIARSKPAPSQIRPPPAVPALHWPKPASSTSGLHRLSLLSTSPDLRASASLFFFTAPVLPLSLFFSLSSFSFVT